MNLLSVSIPNLPNGAAVGAGVSTAVTFKDKAGNNASLVAPGNDRLSGKTFVVRAGGRVLGGVAAETFQVTLKCGATVIEQSTAQTVDDAAHNWLIEARLVADSDSDKIQGAGFAIVAGVLDALAALDNIPTSVDLVTEGALAFSVTGQFSGTVAAQHAHLDFFDLDIL